MRGTAGDVGSSNGSVGGLGMEYRDWQARGGEQASLSREGSNGHHTMNHTVPMAGPMGRLAAADPRASVPGYSQNILGGMSMNIPEDDVRRLAERESRGLRRDWSHVKGLATVVRVLPPELYEKVMEGNELLEPGSSTSD